MQIPQNISASVLTAIAILLIIACNFEYLDLQYAPLYLLISAFGAWFVSTRYGLLLLTFISFIEFVHGNSPFFHEKVIISVLDIGLSLGSAVALVLMLGVARQALEIEWRFARVDALTGALNRKAFFEAVEGGAHEDDVAVLIFADINGLKKLNDSLGHKAGDDALRDFADRIRNSIRKKDLFARIGGDEFVVFLKVRDRAAASVVAERLNGALNIQLNGRPTELTSSLGVLVLPEGSRSIDDELRQADSLMYYAKKSNLKSIMAISINGNIQYMMPISGDGDRIFADYSTARQQKRFA